MKWLFRLLFLLPFVAAAILHAYLYSEGFYAISADESARTIQAYQWYQSKSMPATVWLPFYRYVVGSALQLFGADLFLVPRIVSFLFGLITLAALGWLSEELFERREITLLTFILGALLPQRVVLSLVPLAEIIFICAITIASLFFARWLRLLEPRQLYLSAASFALASMLRYEGWLFCGCLLLFLCWLHYTKKIAVTTRTILASTIILLIFPLCWMLLHAQQHGNPFWFVTGTTNRYAFIYGDSLWLLFKNSVFYQFLQQNYNSFNLWGLIAFISLTLTNHRIRHWAIVPSAAFLLMSIISLAGKALPTHNFWRIAAVWTVLLLPFTAYWLTELAKLFQQLDKAWDRVLQTLVLLIFLTQFSQQCYEMTRYSEFLPHHRQAGDYLATILERAEEPDEIKILIEQVYRWHQLNIVVASQHPDNFIYHNHLGTNYGQVQSLMVSAEEKVLDEAALSANHVLFLLFQEQKTKDFLQKHPRTTKIAEFGDWSLYERR
jgi:hypothetical protein